MATFSDALAAAELELGDAGNETLDEGTASGQVGDVGTDGGQPPSTDSEASDAPSYFDLDQYGSQVVKITVDGQERDVPVSELRNGYMRQESYTQKTQGLAAERARLSAAEALASAYERNPQETVRFLAQQQGITLAEATAQAEAAGDEQESSWANDGNIDPRVGALDQRLAAIEMREANMELERTLNHLGNLYGEDFDRNEVVAKAIQLGRTDLEGVFKQMSFDKFYARQGAEKEVAQRTAAEEASRTAAKQTLASTVASGQSFNGAGAAGSTPTTTVAAAFGRALEEHGDGFDF